MSFIEYNHPTTIDLRDAMPSVDKDDAPSLQSPRSCTTEETDTTDQSSIFSQGDPISPSSQHGQTSPSSQDVAVCNASAADCYNLQSRRWAAQLRMPFSRMLMLLASFLWKKLSALSPFSNFKNNSEEELGIQTEGRVGENDEQSEQTCWQEEDDVERSEEFKAQMRKIEKDHQRSDANLRELAQLYPTRSECVNKLREEHNEITASRRETEYEIEWMFDPRTFGEYPGSYTKEDIKASQDRKKHYFKELTEKTKMYDNEKLARIEELSTYRPPSRPRPSAEILATWSAEQVAEWERLLATKQKRQSKP